ncbi:hypothetical protein AGOR_G00227910 [Albula goreensis]|uniref:Uncharacterized protein n=1 Tax=Albula goreensis TaxID=1534307 RepID=A0A8T3CJC6_9TELE|nr:hypothetical protein AGOR_G00227910 [Albula goreensis]
MQNFRNNSAPSTLPPGFSGGSGVGGGNSSYLSQSSAPQCSPRMPEEYAGVQQQTQQTPQTQNQHPHHLAAHHPSQVSLMMGYGVRNRGSGSGEALHSSTSTGGGSISTNPYRKEMMDHYFSMSGKERHRRGGQGLGYGTGFGYPNMDGHMPHQYRLSGAGSGSSGMMAHYQLDYSAAAGSGGSSSSSSSSSSGTGAFSPSHQYSLSQNPLIQTATGPPIHQRQQAQNYPTQQALHQGQPHRGYPVSGHRMPHQFAHYSSPNTPTGTTGMYNSPPLRYHGGSNSGSFECKVNSSSTANSNASSVSSANSKNTGPLESAGQSYSSSGYSSYHSQPAHSHHKHSTHPPRGSHHNLGPNYDTSHKVHPSSLLHQPLPTGRTYPENAPSVSSAISSANPSASHFSSPEIQSKSPMHSQSQPPQVHQNFSPISNPSPAASTVQSPSCSSSPSPLMGISEPGNSTGPPTHPPSQPPLQKTRNSHSHGRLLQTVSQLSPTPNSNSSISSCGSSSGNVNTAGLNSSPGSNSMSVRSRIGVGIGGGREENSSSTIYPSSPLDKLMPDPGINSLNALTSQVANLPNTVQHMLLSDSLLPHKSGKEIGYQGHMREHQMQQSHAFPAGQQRNRVMSATFSTRAAREGTGTTSCGIANSDGGAGANASQVQESLSGKGDGEEQFSGREAERVRQMSGASSGSEPTGYYPPSQNHRTQIQPQPEQGCQSLPLQIETGVSTKNSPVLTSSSIPEQRTTEHETGGIFPKSPASSSPSSHPPSAQPSPKLPSSCPPASSVPTSSSPSPSCTSSSNPSLAMETGVGNDDSQNILREREKEQREVRNKKEGESEEKGEVWKSSKETDVSLGQDRNQDKQGVKEEGMDIHTDCSKRKDDKGEKHEKTPSSEDTSKNLNTEESHNVGVIVSARSEIPQPGPVTEQLETATSATSNSLHHSHNPRNYSEEKLSHSSIGDSNSLNGEDGGGLSTYPSNYGTKVTHKPGSEHPLSPCPNSSETPKFPYGSSEIHHGSGTDLKNRGRGGMGTNVKYQGYHQPQPSYNSGPRKGLGISGVDEQIRRGIGSASRGQENNSQLQQPFPSLLQEVLQGYHLDRRYGRPENSAQKIPNIYSQSQTIAPQSHSRHPYDMSESARSHVVPQTGNRGDHQPLTQIAVSGKPHPPNQGQGSGTSLGQDSSIHSWGSGGIGEKGAPCSTDKRKIGTSEGGSIPRMQQSTESPPRPPPKHINLADYSLPHRRHSSNHSVHQSAVQQILLQETEPLAGCGVPKGQTQPHTSSSGLMPSVSSSERRSVICDISPSCHTTPERERDGDKDIEYGKSRQQAGPSVIQQSYSTPAAMQEPENIKVEEREKREMDLETVSKTTKEATNLTINSGNFPAKEASVQHQNCSPHTLKDINTDSQRSTSGRKGDINSTSSPTCPPKQVTQHPLSTPSLMSSPPSRGQSYFHSLDGASGRSTGLGRYESGEASVGTPKAISYQPHYPSHPHHHMPSKTQPENSKSSVKLQMYPHTHSDHQPHVLDDRCEWTASNSNRSSEDMMMSPRPGRPQHQSPPRQRSHNSFTGTHQHHLQGGFYDPVKMWGLSERESGGPVEGGNSRRTQLPSAASPGALAVPPTPASGPRCVQSNPPREEIVKSFHPVPTSSSHTQSGFSNSSSSSGSNINLGTQQGHGQNKTGGSGDTNPLMLRRRVRSFISPIPAKRQHQDLQHHQRGSSGQYPAPLPTSDLKHQNDGETSGPDPSHTKMAIPNTPSPPHSKTKILPPRKGRGLKLEAIVQKITPNIKKATNNSSNTNSVSNNLSGLSHGLVTNCNTEVHDQDTCIEGNFPGVGSGTGSCLPYLSEGLSLDEIMYYRGVEETGPLPPSAYSCDPHQDPQILKRDLTGNITRGAIDLEPDFGLGVSVSPLTERDGVGERGKDELRIDSDFPLLGPLPPPPPLPRPVQASPPPSSSALSDIQHFTNTYQQLETRRGEHSAATLLRQKLQESAMSLGMDDYTGGDYFGSQPPHHNQNVGACLLNRAQHTYQHHRVPSARTTSSMAGLSQLPEPKTPENVVPKGYFPSGKKKGRPVGSVNKQKRAQPQAQNVSLNTPPVTDAHTPAPAPTPAFTPAQTATLQIVSSASCTTETPEAFLPVDSKISSASVSPAASQTLKTDVDSEEVQQPETEVQSHSQHERKAEDEGNEVWVASRQRRRRRRGVVGMPGKEELKTGTEDRGTFGASGSFPDFRRSVFAPYIHVERKEEEIGAVCTIVNAEDDRMKGENIGEGGADTIFISTSSQGARGDREMDKVRDKKETEQADSAILESCTAGKALPSTGYVLSGAVMADSSSFGQLLCCLCKKWANYKNLGDLYGPYYPPEYTARLPKNHTQIRQSLLTSKVGSTGIHGETESMKQDIKPIEDQTNNSVTETEHTENQTGTSVSATATDTVCPVTVEMHNLTDSIGSVDFDNQETKTGKLTQDFASTDEALKPEQSDLKKTEPQPQIQQWPTEDIQQRPQHRKLTSHPRFKRRHKSSEECPKLHPQTTKPYCLSSPLHSRLTRTSLSLFPSSPSFPRCPWIQRSSGYMRAV